MAILRPLYATIASGIIVEEELFTEHSAHFGQGPEFSKDEGDTGLSTPEFLSNISEDL